MRRNWEGKVELGSIMIAATVYGFIGYILAGIAGSLGFAAFTVVLFTSPLFIGKSRQHGTKRHLISDLSNQDVANVILGSRSASFLRGDH